MSDTENNNGGERDDDIVAAEFVLGVLPADARAVAARRLESDRKFALRVSEWEAHFAALNADYGAESPPETVWRGVEGSLFPASTSPRAARTGLWNSLVFWRGLAMGAVAAVAIMATFLLRDISPNTAGPDFIASLSASGSDAAFVVLSGNDGALHITSIGIDAPEGSDHELWVIAGDDTPISLGLIDVGGPVTASLPAALADVDPSELLLAVSLEPAGGSPTGAPTGPVVAAGYPRKI